MADEDLNRPYVGYRSAGRRPESRQDRRASADMPVQAARGWVAGTLGLPGDIEGLARMLVKYGAAPGSVVDRKMSETPALPTTEFYKEWLPLRSEAPAAKLAGDIGSLFGGAGSTTLARGALRMPLSPVRAAVELPRNIARAGREFLQSGVPAHVVKPKGGNWLTGSVEDALRPLKQRMDPELEGYARRGQNLMPHEAADVLPKIALNDWIDKKLAKYIKNEMATPEDPLRALIQERGVSHMPIETLQEGAWLPENTAAARVRAGFPEEGMAMARHAEAGYPQGAAEDLARAAEGWESASDTSILSERAGDLLRLGDNSPTIKTNPWLAKVPPETPVYSLDMSGGDLDFPHIVDELRNALNPNSGLPRHLQLTPEQLGRVSTPQAVELVSKINEYRAAEKVAADLARAQNAAVHTFKEYPEKGFKWVELRAPEQLKGVQTAPYGDLTRNATPEQRELYKSLEDALKYEGDTMGHCVGGYCPDVLEGRSRIFSLRDKKGQPHVTIETGPVPDEIKVYNRGVNNADMAAADLLQNDVSAMIEDPNLPKNVREDFLDQLDFGDEGPVEVAKSFFSKYRPDLYQKHFVKTPLDRIVQIKGKANRAPKEEYLPYVQDFVKSQQWSNVGDLQNTGLVQIGDRYIDANRYRDIAGDLNPNYFNNLIANRVNDLSPEDADIIRRLQEPEGFAAGGLVQYNPARVDEIANALREELNAYQ